MSTSEPQAVSCAHCGSSQGHLLLCGACQKVAYCNQGHQRLHWKESHKYLCQPGQYIRGTRIKASNPLAANPLSRHVSYPRGRSGRTQRDPLQAFMQFKYEKSGSHKVRLIKPGKLTPYINRSRNHDPNETEFPYESLPSQLVPLPDGRHRHIASFNLEELLRMGWDGAMYNSTNTYPGVWVPFVSGYDSDPDDTYEVHDIRESKRAGLAGLSPEEVGRYMMIPGQGLVQLKR